MSPYGHIATVYRATVTVPDDVYDAFGHTPGYNRFSAGVTQGMDNSHCSGQNACADCEEWLESLVREDCEVFIDRWHNQILQWQAQLRSES